MTKLQLRTTEMFDDVQTDIYENDSHEMFMTARQLGECLGYASKSGIDVLISRNPYLKKSEFSGTYNLLVPQGNKTSLQLTRVFNEDGIYEVTMIANTEKAKEFRCWVCKLLKSLRRGDINLITKAEYILLQNQIIEANNALLRLENHLTPTKPDYWRWKNNVSSPLIKQLAEKLGIEKRDAFDIVYNNMASKYGFDRSFAINQKCCKYNTTEEYVIDAIADCPEYQSWFYKTVTALLDNTPVPCSNKSKLDKVQTAIQPLVNYYNDKSANYAHTYNKVYSKMTSKQGWKLLLSKNRCQNKKALLLKREDLYKKFCKCVKEIMEEEV